GDTRVPEEALALAAGALLGLPEAPAADAIAHLIGRRQIVASAVPDGSRLVADARLAAAEAGIAERIELLLAAEGKTLLSHATAALDWNGLFGPPPGDALTPPSPSLRGVADGAVAENMAGLTAEQDAA